MQQTNPRERSDYQIGVVCALAIEKAAVRATLDGDEHPQFEQLEGDDTQYTLGWIGAHNVVVACLPAGDTGTANACNVATHMQRSFPIKFGLMVGVAGGVWSEEDDVHLGDVVVSQPRGQFGGVVQWDFGKTEKDGKFKRTSSLNEPPRVLLNALQTLKENHLMKGNRLPIILNSIFEKEPFMAEKFSFPGAQHDHLFASTYDYENDSSNCDNCDPNRLTPGWATRKTSNPEIYYDTIASANHLMRHGLIRDRVAKDLNVICFEMEAADLINSFPCLVIRGICDYADIYKNKR
jgi:nucleoside phosphorylase